MLLSCLSPIFSVVVVFIFKISVTHSTDPIIIIIIHKMLFFPIKVFSKKKIIYFPFLIDSSCQLCSAVRKMREREKFFFSHTKPRCQLQYYAAADNECSLQIAWMRNVCERERVRMKESVRIIDSPVFDVMTCMLHTQKYLKI